jgi:hypothetical protein
MGSCWGCQLNGQRGARGGRGAACHTTFELACRGPPGGAVLALVEGSWVGKGGVGWGAEGWGV